MAPSPAAGSRRALALICAFAVAISTSYTNHGPLLGLISDEFRLTAAAQGTIATWFFAGAAVSMLVGGLLADRVGPKPAVTAGFLVAALANVASGAFVPSFEALLVWRFVGGVGGGLAFAAGAAYTRSVFARRGAHLAQGLYGASFLLGSGSTLVFIPMLVGGDGDWRRAYLVSGIAVLLVWAAWAALAPRGRAGDAGARLSLGAAVLSRNTWLLGLAHMCGFGLAMVVGTWVTAWLVERFGLGLAIAGALGSIVLVTGIFARSAGGAVLERGVGAIRLVQASLALAAAGLAVMALAPWLPAAIGGLLVTGIGVGLPYAAVFNGAAASVPRAPASAQALVGWCGTIAAVVGPPVVGGLLDATGGFAGGYLALALFTSAVLAATLALRPFSLAPAAAAPSP